MLRSRLQLREKLKEKLVEALQAVLPIVAIVLVLSFFIAPLSPSVLLCFYHSEHNYCIFAINS